MKNSITKSGDIYFEYNPKDDYSIVEFATLLGLTDQKIHGRYLNGKLGDIEVELKSDDNALVILDPFIWKNRLRVKEASHIRIGNIKQKIREYCKNRMERKVLLEQQRTSILDLTNQLVSKGIGYDYYLEVGEFKFYLTDKIVGESLSTSLTIDLREEVDIALIMKKKDEYNKAVEKLNDNIELIKKLIQLKGDA